jgi:hypothetical protein
MLYCNAIKNVQEKNYSDISIQLSNIQTDAVTRLNFSLSDSFTNAEAEGKGQFCSLFIHYTRHGLNKCCSKLLN